MYFNSNSGHYQRSQSRVPKNTYNTKYAKFKPNAGNKFSKQKFKPNAGN